MESFTSYNPTRLEFGKGKVKGLVKDAREHGTKALVIIGKGSVKRNGVLDEVLASLQSAGVAYEIFEGIRANPIYEDADAAIAKAKEFGAEMLVAVGGGSVIDTAKAVAMGFYQDHSVWDFYVKKASAPEKALPLFVVLTLAATGTEMNPFTVLQNDQSGQKYGFGNPLLYPKVAYLDPTYTMTVPANQTAYGIADLLAHTLEQYFDPSDSPLSNAFAADVISQALHYGPVAIKEPESYEARANIMWLATIALNGTLKAGKRSGDWGVHAYEHSLSVLFDVPHGAGLSAVYPAWMRFFQSRLEEKLAYLSQRCFGSDQGADFIDGLEQFYRQIGTPVRLSELGIGDDKADAILANLAANKATGAFFSMGAEEHKGILRLMW